MEETTIFEAVPKVDAEYEVAIDGYLAAMERMKLEMDERQARIAQMQAETEVLLAGLKVV